MVLDDGLVVLSSEQCSDDLLLLSLVERCIRHWFRVGTKSTNHGTIFLYSAGSSWQTFDTECVLGIVHARQSCVPLSFSS
jgi:hypothetical protein